MNKKTKKIFAIFGIVATLGILTSCNSFCSVKDSASFRYSVDPINTVFFETEKDAVDYLQSKLAKNDKTVYFEKDDTEVTEETIKNYTIDIFDSNGVKVSAKLINKATIFNNSYTTTSYDFSNIYFIRTTNIKTYSLDANNNKTSYNLKVSKNSLVDEIETAAKTSSYNLPSNQFWTDLDIKSLNYMFEVASSEQYFNKKSVSSAYELLYGYTAKAYNDYQKEKTDEKRQILLNGGTYSYFDEQGDLIDSEKILGRNNSLLTTYGEYKYLEPSTKDKLNMAEGDYWKNITTWNNQIKNEKAAIGITSGYAMSSDILSTYKTKCDSKVVALKSCYTIDDGFYGHTSEDELNDTIQLTNKSSWGDAWSHGWLEGLLVYPIAYMVEYFSHSFGMNGWGQVASVLLVTVIVRLLFMVVSFYSTLSQQKMTMLQPEIAKLQQKYPNSETNDYEKQRLAQAQMALYKKHKVHPFASFLVMIIQFPLFIAVWNGMSGAASLSVDAVLGLRLSDTIWDVLKNFSRWPSNPGWWTALILILLMSAAQIISMKVPQRLQKKQMEQVSKLNKSSAETSQQKQMKIMSWVMTVFIIVMGFTLPAAMGVYWFSSALFAIAQSVIMHIIMVKKKNNRR